MALSVVAHGEESVITSGTGTSRHRSTPREGASVQVDRRTGLEVMEQSECLALLGQHVLGRLAVIEGGAPLILPVNYSMVGHRVVVRTAEGAKFDAVHRSVCFEVDDYDRAGRTGWSVVVRGQLYEALDSEIAKWDAEGLLPQPWAEGPKDHVIGIEPSVITGRRIHPRRLFADSESGPA